ncbi:MAG: Ni/Fe hydrogenase subunit alpha [Anaerolineae bacterium]|nr:Ni/Fe hydrogenase subunit alpha [Anaerolineae bacterium]
MPTLTFPLSRIEGHAQVVIEVHGGEVVSAHFEAMEIRGFRYFVQGVPAEQMPVVVPRICGVCSTAHHVASVEALEDAYGVTPPPLGRTIRELLMLGQIIQNQATSVFLFTMPDRLGTASMFEPMEGVGSPQDRAVLATRALKVRKVGTDLISLTGGQFIHPVKATVGGVTSGVAPGPAAEMRQQIREALPIACELFDRYWETSFVLRDRIGTWGDDGPAHYITATGETCPNYDGHADRDVIRVLDLDGVDCEAFAARDFRDVFTFEETDYSYAGRTSYQGEVMRANSLARINMTRSLGTARADEYLSRFREVFGQPAHAILLFDLCRGIELVYALERALQILEEPLDDEHTAVPHTPQDGEGFGLVEAPRGPLIHHYVIEGGLIADAEFIIPTVHNNMAIERALRVAARRYITAERIDMELEHAVGRVVRAFDPCIACATH